MSTIKAANIQNPSAASAAIVLDTSGNFSVPAGTVSAPGIQAPSDSNTGIFFPAADTIAFAEGGTEAMRIDSSSRLLLGTSSARNNIAQFSDPYLQIEGNYSRSISVLNNENNGNASGIALSKIRSTSVLNSGDIPGIITFGGYDGTQFREAANIQAVIDATPGSGDMPGRLVFSTTADGASSPTERMRIANTGQVLVNTTSTIPSFIFNVRANSDGSYNPMIIHEDAASGSPARTAINFYRTSASASVGNISTTNTATSYNTSSDYRLKENVVPVTDGIVRLQQLKPSRFNFIASPGQIVDGFIAHEVEPVVPEAVTGEKDAVDDDGNPIYQGIDQSKLVPLLTAALQEAIGEIESLKARLTAAGI